MAITLDEPTRRILDGKNFATVATVNPDGGPTRRSSGTDATATQPSSP